MYFQNTKTELGEFIYTAEVIFLISAKMMNVGRIPCVTTCLLTLISGKVENLKGLVIIGGCATSKRVWATENILWPLKTTHLRQKSRLN